MPVNAELANALKKARSGVMKFAFIAKGNEGVLLVDRKIVPADVRAAKSNLSGGTLFQGTCFGEGGLLVFEVSTEAPSSLEGNIKRTIHRDAGMSLHVEVRVNAALGKPEGGASLQEAETAPAPENDESAAFVAHLKTILPTYKEALQSPNSEWVAQLKAVFAAMQDAFKAKDFDTSNAQLKALLQLLLKKPATQETVATEPPAGNEEQFKARLNKVMPVYEKARTLVPGLAGLMTQVMTAADEKRFANGLHLLTQLVDALKAATATPRAPSEPPATDKSQSRPAAAPKHKDEPGLKVWQQAAQTARYQVRRLQLAIKLVEHEVAPQVVEILDGLVTELEKDPTSLAETLALEQFVQNDDRIDSAETPNPFDVEVRLRDPLLAALAQRKLEFTAPA